MKPAAPVFKLGWPSHAVPVGRTVKAAINTLACEKVAGKNQYAAWGQNGPVRTSTSQTPSSSGRTIFNVAA
jgi:hypothetical protein